MTDEERRKAYQAEAGPILDEYFQLSLIHI